jgi:hypothetical protein
MRALSSARTRASTRSTLAFWPCTLGPSGAPDAGQPAPPRPRPAKEPHAATPVAAAGFQDHQRARAPGPLLDRAGHRLRAVGHARAHGLAWAGNADRSVETHVATDATRGPSVRVPILAAASGLGTPLEPGPGNRSDWVRDPGRGTKREASSHAGRDTVASRPRPDQPEPKPTRMLEERCGARAARRLRRPDQGPTVA